MTFIVVQHGFWQGVEADILLESSTGSAFLTAARDYCKATGRAMPEIAEPAGGLRTIAQTTEMQWAFDYGPHGSKRAGSTAAQRAQSAALYLKYNMSTVSTARPSISGTHTTGFYFDVATAAFQAWLLAGNAARYGLTRPLGTADPNHWKYTPGTATAALDVTSLDNNPTNPLNPGDTMKFLKVMLNPDVAATHYIGYVVNDDGIIVEKEDVQSGWSGVQPFVPNPRYVLLEKLYGAGLPIAAYTYSNEEFAQLQAMWATWPKPASGSGVPADYFSDPDGATLQKAVIAAMPTKEDIAAEVIRQMKLPGN